MAVGRVGWQLPESDNPAIVLAAHWLRLCCFVLLVLVVLSLCWHFSVTSVSLWIQTGRADDLHRRVQHRLFFPSGACRVANTSLSLLERLQDRGRPDNESWTRMVDMYSPLIRNWLKRHGLEGQDADDIVQEVLSVVFRRLPDFQRNDRTGSFRAWLRTIAVNCLRDFWKSRRRRKAGAGLASGSDDVQQMLDELADSASALSQLWDREHDRHVTQYLLQLIKPEFSDANWEAFERVAIRGESAKTVAADLDVTLNAIYIARSRILARLREECSGIVDSEFS